jgi:voltage-gated potassium channel
MNPTQAKPWRAWTQHHRFTVLLCGLAVMIFASPIINALRNGPPSLFSRLLVLVCFSVMLLSALFAISQARRHLIIATVLCVPTVVLQSINAVRPHEQVSAYGYGFSVLFLAYIIVLVIQALFQQRSITGDTICASLCAYLLLGMCWAFIYVFIEYQWPGSFSISDVHSLEAGKVNVNVSGAHLGFATYYSFVTLSTLGYGDVIPIKTISRVFSYSEAVLGQIYLAVLVARLVGLHISQSMGERGSD